MGKTFTKRTKQKINKPWYNPDSGYNKLVTEREWKSCDKKSGTYQSERLAEEACMKLEMETNTKWKSYKCEFCKKHHLTQSKKRN